MGCGCFLGLAALVNRTGQGVRYSIQLTFPSLFGQYEQHREPAGVPIKAAVSMHRVPLHDAMMVHWCVGRRGSQTCRLARLTRTNCFLFQRLRTRRTAVGSSTSRRLSTIGSTLACDMAIQELGVRDHDQELSEEEICSRFIQKTVHRQRRCPHSSVRGSWGSSRRYNRFSALLVWNSQGFVECSDSSPA